MGAEIGAKSEKGGKMEVQKSMQKTGTILEASGDRPWAHPGSILEPAGGLGGTGETGFDSDLLQNAMHPAGCGGCFFIKKRSLGATGSIDSPILLDF